MLPENILWWCLKCENVSKRNWIEACYKRNWLTWGWFKKDEDGNLHILSIPGQADLLVWHFHHFFWWCWIWYQWKGAFEVWYKVWRNWIGFRGKRKVLTGFSHPPPLGKADKYKLGWKVGNWETLFFCFLTCDNQK